MMTRNGHCTYLPGNEWILNDAYPDEERNQELYLYHVETGKKISLGEFHTPGPYTGEWRCDLHPRFSPDGRLVTIDSPHGGNLTHSVNKCSVSSRIVQRDATAHGETSEGRFQGPSGPFPPKAVIDPPFTAGWRASNLRFTPTHQNTPNPVHGVSRRAGRPCSLDARSG